MTSIYGIERGEEPPAMEARGLSVTLGASRLVRDVSIVIPSRSVVALVGPSGGGKSSLLKSLNRMNDFTEGMLVEGEVRLHGQDIYRPEVDPTEVRRRVGMVFQRPNPFPMSIAENVAFGPKVNGYTGDLDGKVEEALKGAALWDEVGDRLFESALGLSGGQQQRLCIARALAVDPEVLLMDEPTSELDPPATRKIEELIFTLKEAFTIVLVTHNLHQAARVSDYTAFIREGGLVEYGPTVSMFTNPREALTEAYLTGRTE